VPNEHEKHFLANKRLGKQPFKHDDRTLSISKRLKELRPSVTAYDATTIAPGFPLKLWGNDSWGDCTVAARCNQFLVNEFPEWHEWLPLSDQIAIETYKRLSHAQTPGDSNDVGLVVLDELRDWRAGWKLPQLHDNSPSGGYSIDCFGSLNPLRMSELKAAIQYLHGVTFGFQLPRAAQSLQVWDCTTSDKGPEWEPGSWGGHCVMGFAFEPHGIHVLTWGEKIRVTSRFIKRYCDEAWAVVPSLDNPAAKKVLDVAALRQDLEEIGATPQS
jgi:hypothetical protein